MEIAGGGLLFRHQRVAWKKLTRNGSTSIGGGRWFKGVKLLFRGGTFVNETQLNDSGCTWEDGFVAG